VVVPPSSDSLANGVFGQNDMSLKQQTWESNSQTWGSGVFQAANMVAITCSSGGPHLRALTCT